MLQSMTKSSFNRLWVYLLCGQMVLAGHPVLALQQNIEVVPNAGTFERVESWFEFDDFQGSGSIVQWQMELNPWSRPAGSEQFSPLSQTDHTALTQQGAGSGGEAKNQTTEGQSSEQPPADTGLSAEQLRQLTRTDTVAQETDAFIRANPLPSPPGVKAGESRFRPPKELVQLMAGKADLDRAPLIPGLNLLSIPEEPADSAPGAVLAPIAGSFTRVYAYENCDPVDKWKIYDPNDAANSDLTVLDHTKGFWLEATSAVDLPFDGTLPATTTFQICPGWNLIGYPAGQSRHITNALQSIEGKYLRVFGFDATDPDDPWEVYSVGVPEWGNDLDLMHPGRGYWVLATETAILEIANEDAAPSVAITSPADLDEVTAPTEIRGTVQSKILDHWTLTYRAVGEPEWVELATGLAPVTEAVLSTFDPTLLLNGLYEIRLEAVDISGVAVEEMISIVVEGKMKIGHFTLSYVDLAVPLSGLDIEVTRTYDSRQRQLKGDFGQGWALDIRQGSYKNNRPPGDGWEILATGGPLGLPCQQVKETKTHLTTVRLSDQEIYRFRLLVKDPATVIGGCFGRAEFEFVDGPLPGSTLEVVGNDEVIYQNGIDRVLDRDTLEIFVPDDVKLTTRDGRVFYLDLDDGVTQLEDLNGNSLQITAAGITHSSGRGVEFVRDTEGRILEIVDPRGNRNIYGYDTQGDLKVHTDRSGGTTSYTYNNHYLEDILNADGIRAVRTEYDDDGRIVRTIDADGKSMNFEHDLEGRREVVTTRLGFTRVVEYDERGNTIRQVNENGEVTTFTYNGNDHVLTAKNHLGHVTAFTYSADFDVLSMKNALGHMTSFTYDAQGSPTSITNDLGQITSHQYRSDGNLEWTQDAEGNRTEFDYNGKGELTSITNALGHINRFEYDSFGNLSKEIDALGNERSFVVDDNGNVLQLTTERTLPNGQTETLTSQFIYDSLDRLITAIAPDGSTRAC